MRRPSLQLRVAAAATLGVALVLIAVSAVTVTTFASRERSSLDAQLRDRVDRPGPLTERVLGPFRGGPPGPGGPEGPPPGLVRGGGVAAAGRTPPPVVSTGGASFLRLVLNGRAIATAGNLPSGTFPLPRAEGFSTVTVHGERWRAYARSAPPAAGQALIQVAAELGPLDDRVSELRNRLIVISAIGVALAAAVAGGLGSLALRPLGALRRAVSGVSSTSDLSRRLPTGEGPVEVDALAGDVNAMLARLQRAVGETERALNATRRFAADAGHELRTPLTSIRANVDALARNPGLAAGERQAALDEVSSELARVVALLDALQALARGDAGAALPRTEVDLVEVLDAAVTSARRRHPALSLRLTAPDGPAPVRGWPEGLRLLADNLVENAARHGRPAGRVDVWLAADDGAWRLGVDDDGPGVPAAERQRIFERFARGAAAGRDGFGLGLALVAQQAALHGGEVLVDDAELGGARFTVTLPRG